VYVGVNPRRPSMAPSQEGEPDLATASFTAQRKPARPRRKRAARVRNSKSVRN
jgi:hypothetical protein